jgi:hypothetical protein
VLDLANWLVHCERIGRSGPVDRLKNKQLPSFLPSRLFIYYNERAVEGHIGTDAGAQLRDGIKPL